MHIVRADLPPSQRAWTSTEHVPSDSLGRLRTSDALPFVFYEEGCPSSIGRSAFGVSYAYYSRDTLRP